MLPSAVGTRVFVPALGEGGRIKHIEGYWQNGEHCWEYTVLLEDVHLTIKVAKADTLISTECRQLFDGLAESDVATVMPFVGKIIERIETFDAFESGRYSGVNVVFTDGSHLSLYDTQDEDGRIFESVGLGGAKGAVFLGLEYTPSRCVRIHTSKGVWRFDNALHGFELQIST